MTNLYLDLNMKKTMAKAKITTPKDAKTPKFLVLFVCKSAGAERHPGQNGRVTTLEIVDSS